MKYTLTPEQRPFVTLLKQAYLNVRLNHLAMMQGKGMRHDTLVATYETIAERLPRDVVEAVEASVDAAIKF